ncbi:ribosome association toxin RatA [Ventosimonas gracilis]|uniref:Ribosome association toxin RatA n=1 Tax=Ventosimonas gracilis TaxID=1680762 RepID=A0A139SWM9_9GAMM|nr:type II toxin-antitoxin system RatA family toxin [Ventosimonas gracilis]KXU39003.1 ribosome association toxin RatA [Ventosimonas gracilis]
MSCHIQRSALLPYSAQSMYELVNDVAHYSDFLPWCEAGEVLEVSQTHMLARLKLGKGIIRQQFVTRNALVPGERIEMNLAEGPFKKLHGLWLFTPLGEAACKISLDLSFDYSGALVKASLGPLFNQLAASMVDAFCARARALFGAVDGIG